MSPAEQQFLTTKFAALDKRLDNQDDVLKRLDYTVNGNGKPGLKTMVDRHDRTIKITQKVAWIVLTPILAAVGAGIVAGSLYLVHVVK